MWKVIWATSLLYVFWALALDKAPLLELGDRISPLKLFLHRRHSSTVNSVGCPDSVVLRVVRHPLDSGVSARAQ